MRAHFFSRPAALFTTRTPRAFPCLALLRNLQAIVRHFHETMTGAMKKGPEIEDTTVDSLANILQNSKLQGTKPDYRFPNQNQLNNCWQTMNEFQVCAEQKGKADVACLQKARDYHSVCPAKWIEVRAPLLPRRAAGGSHYLPCAWLHAPPATLKPTLSSPPPSLLSLPPSLPLQDWKTLADEGRNITVGKEFF